MKDQEFKDIWRSLEENPGVPITGKFDAEQFKRSRSSTIKDQIRKIMHVDLWIKLVSIIIILLDIAFYINITDVLYVCIALLFLIGILALLEYKALQQFNRISDPSLNTRDNLSEILIFLQRKSNLLGILSGSTMLLGYFPAIFAYFFIAYGFLKPMTGMSFFVFSTFALIGAIMAYSRVSAQIKFFIKHITICMSDLNDNILQMAYSSIEKERKKDDTLKIVVGLLLVFAFTIFAIVIKKITG